MRSYIQLVFQRLCKEMRLQVLGLCEHFSLKYLHCTSERWLVVIVAFIWFAAVSSSLAGHDTGSRPNHIFCTKCDGCNREGFGWEVRCFDGRFLPSGTLWSTKALIARAAGACGLEE